jgi:hypothetical protein
MHSLPAHLLAFAGASLGTPWLVWQEAKIQSEGRPLNPSLIHWARSHGVPDPGQIRFLRAEIIPLPAPIVLRKWLDTRGFPCIRLAGLCLRDGIYLNKNLVHVNEVMRHELIHTRQYREAGSIWQFLRRYLFECLTEGYFDCGESNSPERLSPFSTGSFQ